MNLLLKKRMKRLQSKHGKRAQKSEMKRLIGMRHYDFVNLQNARRCSEDAAATLLPDFDADNLIPKSGQHFSPFMANAFLVSDWPKFARDQSFRFDARSEEHTSELQSLRHLVCR